MTNCYFIQKKIKKIDALRYFFKPKIFFAISQFFAIFRNLEKLFASLRFAQTKNYFASLRFAIFREKNFAFASLRNLILSDIWSPVAAERVIELQRFRKHLPSENLPTGR